MLTTHVIKQPRFGAGKGMSLDVIVELWEGNAGKPWRVWVCSFPNEGCYWFLFPLFTLLGERTGQRIDLYNDATFVGEDLETLAETIAAARRLTMAQPETWQVTTGTMTHPVVRELRETVRRQEMNTLLDGLEAAINRARAHSGRIVFLGD